MTAASRGAVAALGYVGAALLLASPVLPALSTALFGDFGDARGVAWYVWARSHGFLDGAVNPLLAAPFGVPRAAVATEPITEGILLVLARMSNEIAALNGFLLLGIVCSALATYALLRHARAAPSAAWAGGLMFGFCPAAVLQATGGHLAYAFNAFVPLFVLTLLRNRARRDVGSAVWVALAFAGVCFTALYIGYLAAWFAVLFGVLDLAAAPAKDRRRAVFNYITCVAVALLMVLPVQLLGMWQASPATRAAAPTRVIDLHQLTVFSARPWDYVLPSIDHPLLGRYVEPFARAHLHGSNLFEQTLYLGWLPLLLLATGFVLHLRGRGDAEQRASFQFFAVAALWMFFVSMPPTLGAGLPTPSWFGYQVAPMFRVYARAGLFVSLFVACAAALTMSTMLRRFRPLPAALMAIAVPALVAFDYWSVPPSRADATTPPPVYAWLAAQPGDLVVVEYPIVPVAEAAHYDYLFWQRLHRKRLVNGASPENGPAWKLHEKVKDLTARGTPAALREAGVSYAIVHRRKYAEGPIPQPLKRYYPPERAVLAYPGTPVGVPLGFREVAVFGDDIVLAPS